MRREVDRRSALITGCGAVSAFGVGVENLWRGLLSGRSAIGPIESFDASGLANAFGGEVRDAEIRAAALQTDGDLERIHRFAEQAAREALADANVSSSDVDPTRVGVILGTTLGGMRAGERWQSSRHDGAAFDVRHLLRFPYYATATTLARRLCVRGPVLSPSIACASGTHAIGLALELIRTNQADVVIAGGTEALSRFVVSGFNCLRATTPDAVRPFDARRNGLLLGEGAAILVVEEESHARRRGVTRATEVRGTGLSSDAIHMTAPARDGAGAARAMRRALDDAALSADQVDFVSAHGTGTVYNDAMEFAALRAVLGERVGRVPVHGIKGALGHTLAAAGSFEAIVCTRVLRESLIPPTAGCEQLDPACPLDVVRGAPREQPVRVALSTSSAFAGNNAALVLTPSETA